MVMNDNLKDVLLMCKKSAVQGKKIAVKNNDALKESIASSRNALTTFKQQVSLSSEDAKIPDHCTRYIREMEEFLADLEHLYQEVEQNLNHEAKQLNIFKLVVYGRTKAGKSTLMETLTKGDGASIGCGAQRTTKDVREYTWNGLTVYDTPGIASSLSEGRIDEEKAYDAAKYGDLLIFLFSDDAPQQEEAKAFAFLKRMGKPILGIINCKSSDSSRTFSKIRLRDVRKKLTDDRLNGIRSQFLRLASEGDNRWDDVKFIYTDLHTAFLSILKEPAEIVEHANELYEISRFKSVENAIIEAVQSKGAFFQFKTFIDITYYEIFGVANRLNQLSNQSELVIESIQRGEDRLLQVRNQFERDANSRIDSFVQRLHRELASLASDFAENNYDNKNASDEWRYALERQRIEEQIQHLLEEIAYDCEERINEFAKEFQQSISFRIRNESCGIDGADVTDYGSGIRIGSAVATIGVGIAALAGFISVGPIGWLALAAVGIFSFFFESKDEKIRKAIQDMRNKLSDNIEQIIQSVQQNMNDIFNTTIMDGYFEKVIHNFNKMHRDLVEFDRLQNVFSRELNHNLLQMNFQLLTEAMSSIGYPHVVSNINRVARVPGEAILVEWKSNYHNYNELQDKLRNVLQEKIIFISLIEDIPSYLAEAFSISRDLVVHIQSKREYLIKSNDSKCIVEISCMPALIEMLLNVRIIVKGELSIQESILSCPVINNDDIPVDTIDTLEDVEHSGILPWYLPDADYSNADVQWDIARHYLLGIQVEKNMSEAIHWAQLAAEQKHSKAQCFLGDCYYFGLSKEINYKKALEWYRLADECGCTSAAKYIGDCYYFGYGVNVDKKIAADYYEKAFNNGYVQASFNLGNAYYLGEGRLIDYDKARYLYQMSAEADFPGAQNNLGNCYYLGQGTALDFNRAHIWYIIANQNGCAEARLNLESFY